MTTFSSEDRRLRMLAENNGWTHRPQSYFGWWSDQFIKDGVTISVRWRNGRITGLHHSTSARGVSLGPITTNKKAELERLLEAK